jgi:signal transduction histidine kinase/ligand-binding sensor domain-containing protein/DNA-binding NarL/FixJ family response regulator
MKQFVNWLSLLLICILIGNQASGNVSFKHYSTLDGLGNNVLFDVETDLKGQIWLASHDGLSCYNGYEFINYKPDNIRLGVLGSNIISVIAPDDEGKIWYGTIGSGMSLFNPNTSEFTHFMALQDSSEINFGENVHTLAHLGTRVWYATSKGLGIYDQRSEELRLYNHDDLGISGGIQALYKWNDSLMCVAVHNRLLLMSHDREQVEIKHSWQTPEGNGIRSLYRDKEGRFWVVCRRYLYCINMNLSGEMNVIASLSVKDLEHSASFISIRQSNKDEYWIACDGQLLSFRFQNNRITSHQWVREDASGIDSPYGKSITGLCIDREGGVWVTTRLNGLYHFNPFERPFKRFVRQPGKASTMFSNDVRNILQDRFKNIWIGYRIQGVDMYNPNDKSFFHFNNGDDGLNTLPSNHIRSFFETKEGEVLVGSSRGITWMHKVSDGYKAETITSIAGKEITTVYYMHQDKAGRLWFGTTAGLFMIDRQNEIEKHYRPQTKPLNGGNRDFIRCIAEDQQGRLWLGTDGGGVDVVDKEKGFIKSYVSTLGKPDGLSHNKAYCTLVDSDNEVWVGTHNGLNRLMADGSFKVYNERNGLVNNIVYSVQEDKAGYIWVSTAKGLSKLNKTDGKIQNYLRDEEFSDDAWFKNHDGELFYGGLNGFIYFDPLEIHPNETAPLISIESFSLKNEAVQPGDEVDGRVLFNQAIDGVSQLDLKHHENFFSLKIIGIALQKPRQVRYQYQLKGFNDEWVDLDPYSRSAIFTNVPPGNYQFLYRAANSDGIWSKEEQLIINIHPAFYQTLWFKLIIAFALALLAALAYGWRVRSLRRQKIRLQEEVKEKTQHLERKNKAIHEQNELLEQQKEEIEVQRDKVVEMTRLVHEADERKIKFFTSISHEIRTPLTLIAGPVSKMLDSVNASNPLYKSISLVEKNTQHLLRLVNQLLDFRKIETGHMPVNRGEVNVVDLAQDIFDRFKSFADGKSQTCIFHSDEEKLKAWLDAEVFEKILSNLLSNAIKYTPEGGKIQLHLYIEEEKIKCSITDDGPGISEHLQERLFKRFYRDEQATQQIGGSGIGLALAKELALIHSGDLYLKSSDHNGSCFEFYVPYERGSINDWADQHKIEVPIEQEEVADLSDWNVLVVEDNDELRAFIADSLGEANIIQAADGEEGMAAALEHLPDLVITDVLMPKKNGFELCQFLKNDPRTNHIPVIVLTAFGSEEYEQYGFGSGADDFIVKPFNHQILAKKVHNILKARQYLKEKLGQKLSGGERDYQSWTSNLPPFVTTILQAIESNISNSQFGVDELSRIMGMSSSTLYRKMKSVTDKSTVEFIREVKIRKAYDFLVEDRQLQIAEAAMKVGFEDVNYFRRCFKKQFGKSPKEMIKGDG